MGDTVREANTNGVKELHGENSQPKETLDNVSLDKKTLQEVLKKSSETVQKM